MRRISELSARQAQTTGALDEHAIGAIYHDIGNRWIIKQWLKRAQTEHVMNYLAGKLSLLTTIELYATFRCYV